MKTSQRILLGMGIALVIAIVGVVAISRSIVTSEDFLSGPSRGERTMASSEIESIDYDIEGFVEVSTSGGWELELSSGRDYTVRLEVSKNLIPFLEVEKVRDRLELGLESDRDIRGSYTMRAMVTLPDLRRVSASGGLDLVIDGFAHGDLYISSSGALKARAENSSFAKLELRASGAADVDFSDSPADSAEIVMSGAGVARILMAGGDLKGTLSGAGRLTYLGEVRDVDVRTSGASSVKRGGS